MTNPTTVLSEVIESTRMEGARIESEIMRRLAEVTQARAAECMGVSASTVSRMTTDDIGKFSQLLASIGLQVAAADSVVVNRADQVALKRMAFNWLKADLESEAAL